LFVNIPYGGQNYGLLCFINVKEAQIEIRGRAVTGIRESRIGMRY
jgi:hypothetical protein